MIIQPSISSKWRIVSLCSKEAPYLLTNAAIPCFLDPLATTNTLCTHLPILIINMFPFVSSFFPLSTFLSLLFCFLLVCSVGFCFLFVCLFVCLVFGERVSYNPGWPGTYCIAENVLLLLNTDIIGMCYHVQLLLYFLGSSMP